MVYTVKGFFMLRKFIINWTSRFFGPNLMGMETNYLDLFGYTKLT